jgi:hypothetical protein
MTDAELRDAAVAELELTTVGYINKNWKTPPAGTRWANALALLAEIGGVTPPPPGWSIAPPQAPVHTITNPPGIGVNITPAHSLILDTVVQGGGDSAFICEKGSDNTVIVRCQAFNVAAGNAVTWGKHAVYGAAKNLTVQDFSASGSQYAADGLSVRFAPFLGQRCQLDSFDFALAVFAEDTVKGTVTWKDIRGSSNNADCGIWLDVYIATKMVYDIVLDDVQLTGPGALFLRANAAVFAGTVTIQNGCTWNGKPVTAAMVGNVPASALKILP